MNFLICGLIYSEILEYFEFNINIDLLDMVFTDRLLKVVDYKNYLFTL